MKQLTTFIKKELMELVRTGKLYILLVIFVLFGIMNPAIAKLTPWMMEAFSDSLADTGLVISAEIEVNAMTSWTQFYKNIPIALVIFVLMASGTLSMEFQKGTLINMLTKGMSRWKVIVSKTFTMIVLWSICYFICFGITYGYNTFFWDNSIALHIVPAAFCVYLLGIWLISLIMATSGIFQTTSGVLAATGIVFVAAYVISMIPTAAKYLPVYLLSSAALLSGSGSVADFIPAMIVTALLSVFGILLSISCFNREAV